jgi:hypothetical protein
VRGIEPAEVVHLGVSVHELGVTSGMPRGPLRPPRLHLGRDVNPGNLAVQPDPSRQLQDSSQVPGEREPFGVSEGGLDRRECG